MTSDVDTRPLVRGLRSYFRGPISVLGSFVGVAFTVVAVIQALRGESVWMWLCFTALALFGISLGNYLRDFIEREQSLPKRLDDLLHEGMALVGELSVPLEGSELPLGPDDESIDRAVDFLGRAQDLLREERPSLLPVFTKIAQEERRKDRVSAEAKLKEFEGGPEGLRQFAETCTPPRSSWLTACSPHWPRSASAWRKQATVRTLHVTGAIRLLRSRQCRAGGPRAPGPAHDE